MPDHLDTLDLDGLRREAERLGYVRDAWGWGTANETLALADDDEAAALRWLLRQPEAVARAACYARGVADGRALERGEHEVSRG